MVPTLDRGLDIDTQHAGVRDEVDVTLISPLSSKFKSQHRWSTKKGNILSEEVKDRVIGSNASFVTCLDGLLSNY